MRRLPARRAGNGLLHARHSLHPHRRRLPSAEMISQANGRSLIRSPSRGCGMGHSFHPGR